MPEITEGWATEPAPAWPGSSVLPGHPRVTAPKFRSCLTFQKFSVLETKVTLLGEPELPTVLKLPQAGTSHGAGSQLRKRGPEKGGWQESGTSGLQASGPLLSVSQICSACPFIRQEFVARVNS